MTRRLLDLTLDRLDALPPECRSCVFWEVAGAARGPTADGPAAKEAWIQATQLEWGPPGKVLVVDEATAGYVLLGPGKAFGRHLGATPSEDALLLATLWVAPGERGAGLAKLLVHAALREAHRRSCRAVEAYGSRGLGDAAGSPCLLGEDFLLALGFAVLREHPMFPLLRLDLRQTVRWQESVSHALEGVRAALRPRERAPAPARPARG